MSAEFLKAADEVKKMTVSPNDQELLEIYALFKQVTVGDCNTDRPGMLDFKGKAKWDAWKSKQDLGKSDAENAYVDLVKRVIDQYK